MCHIKVSHVYVSLDNAGWVR
uniref:Uncharacterized protein n=1 Tax=Arundo donax TaxID=35708 RepID=A0A0A9HU87_ARUDO